MIKVTAHPKTGEVLTINPENGWGTFRLDSEQRVIENGIFSYCQKNCILYLQHQTKWRTLI